MWAKPLGLAQGGGGGSWREMEKDTGGGGGKGSTGAQKRDEETRKGKEGASEGRREKRVKEREKKDAHGCRWETNDRRPTEDTSKLLQRCRCPASFYVCPPPPSLLRVYILHVARSRANDLLAKYSGKRRRVPPASFSNEYFDTGDASDVSPSPVSLCLIYRTLAERFPRVGVGG